MSANNCDFDDSDSGPESNVESVELGFVERLEPEQRYRLQGHYFPLGKVGGTPAWLSFTPLPCADWLKCQCCSKPLCFLLQIYAPVDLPGREDCFHRNLYLFVCRNAQCSQPNSPNNLVALRCQLPRQNPFYGADGAPDPDDHKFEPSATIESFSQLCQLCGCSGDKRCGKCQKATYCSREHQAMHWKLGHRQQCANEESVPFENTFLFPEYELVTETEFLPQNAEKSTTKQKTETERLAEYEKYLEKSKQPSLTGIAEEMEEETPVDKQFERFNWVIKQNPEQVLRYQRQGRPLWPADLDASVHVPVCELCGANRDFEFQVMPHLLEHLGVDSLAQSIDWATVVVFTCSQNCNVPDNGYAREFVIKQDFS